MSLHRLRQWWLQRCDEFIIAKFRVIIPLWCSVHHISFLDAVSEITVDDLSATKSMLRHDISSEGLLLYRVLARPVDKEAAQRVMAEMDHDGRGLTIDRAQAQQWWEEYSDDLRAFDAAWRSVDRDCSDEIAHAKVPSFIQMLLTPMVGQVMHAVDAAARAVEARDKANVSSKAGGSLAQPHTYSRSSGQRSTQLEVAGASEFRLLKHASGRSLPPYLRPGMRVRDLKFSANNEWKEVTVHRCALFEWWRETETSILGKRDKHVLRSELLNKVKVSSHFLDPPATCTTQHAAGYGNDMHLDASNTFDTDAVSTTSTLDSIRHTRAMPSRVAAIVAGTDDKQTTNPLVKLLQQWEQIHREDINGDVRGQLEIALYHLGMLQMQRKLTLVEIQYVIVELLTPTTAGIERVQVRQHRFLKYLLSSLLESMGLVANPVVHVLPFESILAHKKSEMDTTKSGNVDKSEAEQWWMRNCNHDLRAFERAWLAVDVDCSNDLDFDEVRLVVGYLG